MKYLFAAPGWGLRDQSAAPGVVIPAGGGGAAEAFPGLFKEFSGEGLQARIPEGRTGGDDMIPVGLLLAGRLGVAPEELFDFALVEDAQLPAFSVDAIPCASPAVS